MDDLYFACMECKIYIDVGDRWAYWKLQHPGVVAKGIPILVDKVLSAAEYWNPPGDENSGWLLDNVLPAVQQFLDKHKCHQIVFGDANGFEGIVSGSGDLYFDWLQVGWRADTTSPRALVQLKFNTWEQVCDYVSKEYDKYSIPVWWQDPVGREKCRNVFEQLIKSSHSK